MSSPKQSGCDGLFPHRPPDGNTSYRCLSASDITPCLSTQMMHGPFPTAYAPSTCAQTQARCWDESMTVAFVPAGALGNKLQSSQTQFFSPKAPEHPVKYQAPSNVMRASLGSLVRLSVPRQKTPAGSESAGGQFGRITFVYATRAVVRFLPDSLDLSQCDRLIQPGRTTGLPSCCSEAEVVASRQTELPW